MKVQRVRLADNSVTWIVLDDDHTPVQPILVYLKYLHNLDRSPNTVRATAHRLKLFWEYLRDEHLCWTEMDIARLAAFIPCCGDRTQRWILCSMGLGPIQAGSILAAIGSIENFPNAGTLKSYFGWAPRREQTGTSFDHSQLTRGGYRPMRQMMFLIVAGAVRYQNSEWAKLYQRLVQAKCPTDTLTGKRKGKMRVIGRIAGQMIETMYALLKTDAEVLSKLSPGETSPPPILYDPEVHRRHRAGHYQPVKPSPSANRIILLPKLS